MLIALVLACIPGGEYEPPLCATHLPRIAAVTIERNGARGWRDPDGPKACTGFRLRKAQVMHYLRHAGTTDPQSADATLDASPCHASGGVRFADGRVGRWTIDQFRQGRLTLPGRAPMILYCPACSAAAFIR